MLANASVYNLYSCDKYLAIRMAQNNMYSDKSRYIQHKQNTIKYLISNGVIFIIYVKSKKNIWIII